MYKKVKQYVLKNNLTVDEKNNLAYGLFNGYFIVIHQDPTATARHTVQMWVRPGRIDPAPSINEFLTKCIEKHQYLQTATYNGAKINAEFQGLGFKWGKNYVPCLDAFLQEIIAYCKNNELLPSCESCSTQDELSLYQIDEAEHVFCPSCYSNMSEQFRHETVQRKKEGNGNMIGGIVGALLGALIGVILWVLVYQLGYICAIIGAVMVICALKGYELLGGKINKTGIIICCLISILMVAVAEQMCLGIEIYQAYKDYYEITFFDAFRSVPSFLTEPEILRAAAMDLIMGYLLMAFGAWGTIRQAYKKGTGKRDVKMIASVTNASRSAESM